MGRPSSITRAAIFMPSMWHSEYPVSSPSTTIRKELSVSGVMSKRPNSWTPTSIPRASAACTACADKSTTCGIGTAPSAAHCVPGSRCRLARFLRGRPPSDCRHRPGQWRRMPRNLGQQRLHHQAGAGTCGEWNRSRGLGALYPARSFSQRRARSVTPTIATSFGFWTSRQVQHASLRQPYGQDGRLRVVAGWPLAGVPTK